MQTPQKSEIMALVASLIPAHEWVIIQYGYPCNGLSFHTKEEADTAALVASDASPNFEGYDSELASLSLTVGASPDGSWSYQTGDNSFTGGAYGHRDWAVVTLDADSKPEEVADDILNQIAELQCQAA